MSPHPIYETSSSSTDCSEAKLEVLVRNSSYNDSMLGRDSRSAMTAASAQPFLKSSRTRRLWSVLWIGFAFLAILLACTLLYNNYSFRSQSRSQFNAQLDGALERATVWIVAHPELSLKSPSIMYMIADMAKMSGDPRPQQLLYEYSQRLQHSSDALDLFWLRITDRHSPLPLIAAPELGGQIDHFGSCNLDSIHQGNRFSKGPTCYVRRQERMIMSRISAAPSRVLS